MFREMRRNKQALSPDEILDILHQGTSGVLAVSGDGGYPYAVPLSYAYHDGKIYFHCATSGHKLDAIGRNEKVSFCVVGQDQVVPQKYTTYYRSVIVFGKARVLQDEAEKRAALEFLSVKYTPGDETGYQAEIEKTIHRTCLVELYIDHMSGKQARELADK